MDGPGRYIGSNQTELQVAGKIKRDEEWSSIGKRKRVDDVTGSIIAKPQETGPEMEPEEKKRVYFRKKKTNTV